jgi:hypothetical protein
MRRRFRNAALALAAAAIWSPLAGAQERALAPRWAVDPPRAGEDLPDAGRSLFDYVVTTEIGDRFVYDVPFPFEALVKRIEARAGCASRDPCVKQVLVPLGRSLQRTAAAPEFFKFPRVVAAVDTDPGRRGAPLLKDRLYLGYQEQAALIEVISYNEAAGRFEFQIVRDYRPGGRPQVVYARRAVCAACHQNLAPIFSRQVWEETNANPQVAALLEREAGRLRYGIPIRRGVDIPNAIDAATDRANLVGVWQLLWRAGCGEAAEGAQCRAAALTAALQYRLTDERAFDERSSEWRETFLPAFAREWRARWPAGLAIPNPDLPNRDPLPPPGGPQPKGLALSHVAARFEPLLPRPPLEVWRAGDAQAARRFVAGLAELIAAADVRALDEHLAARPARERRYEAPCELASTHSTVRFRCVGTADLPTRIAGRADLRGARVTGGELTELAAGGATALEHLEVESGAFNARDGRMRLALRNRGLAARLADGSAVASVELRWQPAAARARGGTREASALGTIVARDDFAPVRAAIAAAATDASPEGMLAARPLSHARVMSALFARLGLPAREWCCDDASRLPPATAEPEEPPVPTDGPAKDFAAFYPLCASCHATSERFPPNFLAGSRERVAAAVRHCAPRIYARLAMWRLAPGARDKTPMPPPVPSATNASYRPPAGTSELERVMAEALRAESGTAPRLDALLERGYEALRPCLPG